MINTQRKEHYKLFHVAMNSCGDCDPAYPALDYVADRFELNIEQRYWLAFLYQATYCVPTAYYIYNEFPDYHLVDTCRLQSWWDANKARCLLQTDRFWVKIHNRFIDMFISYRNVVGNNQHEFFTKFIKSTPLETYNNLYDNCNVYYISRYSKFLWFESLYRLTNLPLVPTTLDLTNADTCKAGLFKAIGWDEFNETSKLDNEQYEELNNSLAQIVSELQNEYPQIKSDYWSVETSLCAYRKLFKPTRYLGYYIDRQQHEISKMQKQVPEGVCWDVLWQFRSEYFDHSFLGEYSGWNGIRKSQMGLPNEKLILRALSCNIDKIDFKGIKQVYR